MTDRCSFRCAVYLLCHHKIYNNMLRHAQHPQKHPVLTLYILISKYTIPERTHRGRRGGIRNKEAGSDRQSSLSPEETLILLVIPSNLNATETSFLFSHKMFLS